jgi:hypothetical protein
MMKTLDQLHEFYQTDLLQDLQVLEDQRRAVVRRVLTVGAVAVLLGLLCAVLFARTGPVGIFIAVGLLIVAGIVGTRMTQGYRGRFKVLVIGKLVRFIDGNLAYTPDQGLPESLFRSAELFKQQIDRFKSEDQVAGKVGATEIAFSEVHAEHRTKDNKGHTEWHTIFRGILFVGDFNKEFHGKTVVLPDTAERLLGSLGQKLQSWNINRDGLVKLEDPEFEKEFVVYATDQVEARYVLSTSLMERILQFKRKTGKRICLSFVGSKVFVAIPYNKNLFEPRLFHTLLDFGPIARYFEDLELAVGIVEDLNLNTRIWSKA